MAGYRDLKVWQMAIRLAEEIYRLSARLPKQEIYGLASQLQRSAISIPSNIAEGHGRNSNEEFDHFLGIALGSLAELETQVILAQRLGYLSEKEIALALQIADDIGNMLKALQKNLRTD